MLVKIIFNDIVDSHGFQLVWELDYSTNIATFDGTVINETTPEEKLTPRGDFTFPLSYQDSLSPCAQEIDVNNLPKTIKYAKLDSLVNAKKRFDNQPIFWSKSSERLSPPPKPPRPDRASHTTVFSFEAIINEDNIDLWRKVGIYLCSEKDETSVCHMAVENQKALKKSENLYIYYTQAQLHTYLTTYEINTLINSKKALIEYLKTYLDTIVAPLVNTPEGTKHCEALKNYFTQAICAAMSSDVNTPELRLEELSEANISSQYEYCKNPVSQWQSDLDEERDRRAAINMKYFSLILDGKTEFLSDAYRDAITWLAQQIKKNQQIKSFQINNNHLKELIIETGIQIRKHDRTVTKFRIDLKNKHKKIPNFTRLSTLIYTYLPKKNAKQELQIRSTIINELSERKLSTKWCPRIEEVDELFFWQSHPIHKNLHTRLSEEIETFFIRNKSSKSLNWKKLSKCISETVVEIIDEYNERLNCADDKATTKPISFAL